MPWLEERAATFDVCSWQSNKRRMKIMYRHNASNRNNNNNPLPIEAMGGDGLFWRCHLVKFLKYSNRFFLRYIKSRMSVTPILDLPLSLSLSLSLSRSLSNSLFLNFEPWSVAMARCTLENYITNIHTCLPACLPFWLANHYKYLSHQDFFHRRGWTFEGIICSWAMRQLFGRYSFAKIAPSHFTFYGLNSRLCKRSPFRHRGQNLNWTFWRKIVLRIDKTKL